RAAPAGVAVRGEQTAGRRAEHLVLDADDGRTALGVDEHVVPGVADLTGDQTERIDLGAVALSEQRAGVVTGEVSPVALAFEAEHPLAGLHAIADLTTDRAARGVVGTFATNQRSGLIPRRVSGSAAAVDTDVEAAPV